MPDSIQTPASVPVAVSAVGGGSRWALAPTAPMGAVLLSTASMVAASSLENYAAALAWLMVSCLLIYSYVAERMVSEALTLARECNELTQKSHAREEELLEQLLRENTDSQTPRRISNPANP